MENDYLIHSNPMKALFFFSMPMVIGFLFQQTYTIADSAIAGRFVGETALAAIGASYAITNIFICIANGGGMGASVNVSNSFGAGDYSKMKTAINTSLITFLIVSIVLGIIGLIFGKEIMIATNTPEKVLGLATEYLNIYFIGLPFLFMYNVLSSMFNALGKSRIPLYFLIFSSLFNIALDWILVTDFGMGVGGVAWATLIAQSISAVMSYIVLFKLLKQFPAPKAKIFDSHALKSMTRIAIPSILQQSTVFIGMLLVQSVVNRFGSETLAGFSAAMRVEALCVVPMVGIGNAASSYTAQNLGAKQPERVSKGLTDANILVTIISIVIFIALEFYNKEIINLFLGEKGSSAAFSTGQSYLSFMGYFFCLLGFKMTIDNVLRGAGDVKVFTIANLANLFIRVAVAQIYAPIYGIQVVWYAVPIGWAVNLVISGARYATGKWKTIKLA